MTAIINLIIAHSHPHFLLILQNIIRSYQGFRVVGKAGNFADLMQMATTLKSDVIVADIALPGMRGFTALQELMVALNQPGIILSWSHHHQPVINEVIAAGCAGCIIHDANPAEYLRAIKKTIKGEVFYCSQTERVIGANIQGRDAIAAIPENFNKKYDILLHCIWLGFTIKETAVATELTKETVYTYRKRLKKIFGSLSAAAIHSYLKKNGIV